LGFEKGRNVIDRTLGITETLRKEEWIMKSKTKFRLQVLMFFLTAAAIFTIGNASPAMADWTSGYWGAVTSVTCDESALTVTIVDGNHPGVYPANIVGGPGNDTLYGTKYNDVIFGLGGDDSIHGKDGNDIICGGDGANSMWGQDGNDILVADPSNIYPQKMYGSYDDDFLLSGAGSDYLNGSYGADLIVGGGGSDLVYGGGDNDVLYGEGGDDKLYGGIGNDTCDGGTHLVSDSLYSCKYITYGDTPPVTYSDN
jgi:Ca2+-binding RTX toxin-like protein